jgi:hypothetical protein
MLPPLDRGDHHAAHRRIDEIVQPRGEFGERPDQSHGQAVIEQLQAVKPEG